MVFQPKRPVHWHLPDIDPNRLSDEQVEYYYQLAREQGRDVEEFEPNTMGRFVVASSYVQFRKSQFRTPSPVSKPV